MSVRTQPHVYYLRQHYSTGESFITGRKPTTYMQAIVMAAELAQSSGWIVEVILENSNGENKTIAKIKTSGF
jgi:hypothetical protein